MTHTTTPPPGWSATRNAAALWAAFDADRLTDAEAGRLFDEWAADETAHPETLRIMRARLAHRAGEHAGDAEHFASVGCAECYRALGYGDDEPEYTGRTIDITPAWADLLPSFLRLYGSLDGQGRREIEAETRKAGSILDMLALVMRDGPALVTGTERAVTVLPLIAAARELYAGADAAAWADAPALVAALIDAAEIVEGRTPPTDGDRARTWRHDEYRAALADVRAGLWGLVEGDTARDVDRVLDRLEGREVSEHWPRD